MAKYAYYCLAVRVNYRKGNILESQAQTKKLTPFHAIKVISSIKKSRPEFKLCQVTARIGTVLPYFLSDSYSRYREEDSGDSLIGTVFFWASSP